MRWILCLPRPTAYGFEPGVHQGHEGRSGSVFGDVGHQDERRDRRLSPPGSAAAHQEYASAQVSGHRFRCTGRVGDWPKSERGGASSDFSYE